jgi:hypothetical protein
MEKIEKAKCKVGWMDLCRMDLHDIIEIYGGENSSASCTVMRVPGGWSYIYDVEAPDGSIAVTSHFVPYSDNYDN